MMYFFIFRMFFNFTDLPLIVNGLFRFFTLHFLNFKHFIPSFSAKWK